MTLSMAPQARTAAPIDEPARIRATIAKAPLFTSLPPAAVDDLTQRIAVRRVSAHGTVVSQDEQGDAMFIIMSGRVKVVLFGENGREVTLSILRPGDGFGEMSLFDGKARSANCIAMEPTALLVLSREDLLRHIGAHPRTALNLLGEMADRLRRADESRGPPPRGGGHHPPGAPRVGGGAGLWAPAPRTHSARTTCSGSTASRSRPPATRGRPAGAPSPR